MKKLLFSLGLISAISFNANSQVVQVGDIAPNFTVTDINNNTHTLYDYLNEGYMVLIDISATWCGPCWSYSSSGIMKEIYEKYGPNGTITPKKIMVLFVEGDASTTLADLQGTGPNTQGDWVTGKPYPIIDNASLNGNYLDGGFPTVTLICPNKEVAFIQGGVSAPMTTLAFYENYMNQCITPVEGTNAALKTIHTPVTACAGNMTKLSVDLLNFGTDPLTNAQITAKLGGVVVASVNWTGNLATFDTETIEIGDISLDDDLNMVTYEVNAPNDAYANDNMLQRNISVLKTNFRSWNIQAKTDKNPNQNAWNIKDESGSVVFSHAYTVNDVATIVNTPVVLEENKCYTLTVTDNGTDGITDGGYIKILDGLGSEIYTINTSYSSVSLNLKSGNKFASINGISSVDALNVYPNPATNTIAVNVTTNKDVKATLSIVDMLGRNLNIQNETLLKAGSSVVNFNVETLNKGIYFINIATEDGTIQTKFVKD